MNNKRIMLFYLKFLSYHDKIHAAYDLKRKMLLSIGEGKIIVM